MEIKGGASSWDNFIDSLSNRITEYIQNWLKARFYDEYLRIDPVCAVDPETVNRIYKLLLLDPELYARYISAVDPIMETETVKQVLTIGYILRNNERNINNG